MQPTPDVRRIYARTGILLMPRPTNHWAASASIRSLDDAERYATVSAACLGRAHRLDPAEDLRRFGSFVEEILASASPRTQR